MLQRNIKHLTLNPFKESFSWNKPIRCTDILLFGWSRLPFPESHLKPSWKGLISLKYPRQKAFISAWKNPPAFIITQLEKNLDELGQLGEEGMNLEKVLKAYVKNYDMDEVLNILNQMDNLK